MCKKKCRLRKGSFFFPLLPLLLLDFSPFSSTPLTQHPPFPHLQFLLHFSLLFLHIPLLLFSLPLRDLLLIFFWSFLALLCLLFFSLPPTPCPFPSYFLSYQYQNVYPKPHEFIWCVEIFLKAISYVRPKRKKKT